MSDRKFKPEKNYSSMSVKGVVDGDDLNQASSVNQDVESPPSANQDQCGKSAGHRQG